MVFAQNSRAIFSYKDNSGNLTWDLMPAVFFSVIHTDPKNAKKLTDDQ